MLSTVLCSALGSISRPLSVRFASSATALQQQLRDALEGRDYISASADQAFLEAEPAERGPKEAYVMRYQDFARKELDAALERWQDHLDEIGPDDSKHLIKDSNLMLTVADAMLARDKLLAAVRESELRMKRKKDGDLKGMQLEHCQ